ncbi:MAG: hypothetical protein HFF71_10795 [Oscillospiraceae bacterium]|nr:hypothetical protein [Oscillospiraceae bacterium]
MMNRSSVFRFLLSLFYRKQQAIARAPFRGLLTWRGFCKNIFSHLEDPDDLYWNYFDQTGEISPQSPKIAVRFLSIPEANDRTEQLFEKKRRGASPPLF